MRKILFSLLAALFCATSMWGEATPIGSSNTYWEIDGTTLTISGSGAMPDFSIVNDQPWNANMTIMQLWKRKYIANRKC